MASGNSPHQSSHGNVFLFFTEKEGIVTSSATFIDDLMTEEAIKVFFFSEDSTDLGG